VQRPVQRPVKRPADSVSDSSLPALSLRSFSLCLGVTLALFVGLNPVWQPLDMDGMDANIGWSYAPIPLLVLAALAFERKLGWASFGRETLKLTLVKFALTFLAANVVWAVTGPPARRAADGAASAGPAGLAGAWSTASAGPREAPVPSVIDPARTGILAGRVSDAGGAPVAGAAVWIADGLRGRVFAPPAERVELSDTGSGFGPALSIVQTFQPVALRSLDGALHTAHAADADGRQLFNYPVLPDEPRALVFERAPGLVTLTCKVHGHDERTARLVVVAHPFAALTDESGRFRFEGVPAGELELVVWAAAAGELRRDVLLQAGAEVALELSRP
jgi:hypothetical protein